MTRKHPSVGGILLALAAMLGATAAMAADGFTDYGVGAPVAESRGVITAQDDEGRFIVLALSLDLSPRGWILVTDIDTGETQQCYYPEGVPNSPPYASLLSKNGRFYTFAGKTLLEFDLTTREWLFHGVPAPSESCVTGSAMVDGPDGLIYAGTHGNCHLVSFDPQTKEMKDYGQLDPAEHYVNQLVADSSGWLYAGIGTARQNLVAYNPATGERVQIAKEQDRVLGTGQVYLGEDGQVYGHAGESWYRMSKGKATEITQEDMATRQPTGAIGWGTRTGAFPDGRKLRLLNLPDRWMEIEDADGAVKRITFDYASEGASITSLGEGPEGIVYGSTVGGGNFCAIACQGDQVIGAQYSAGALWAYDVNKPWNPTGKPETLGVSAQELIEAGAAKDGHFTYLASHDIAFLHGDKFGAEGTFKLNAPAAGKYYLYVAPYQSDRYCTVQFLFDGEEIGEPYVAANPTTQIGPLLAHGPMDLRAGEHTLTIRTLETEGQEPWCAIQSVELTTEKRETLVLEDTANPRVLAQWHRDICRPRTALAHPDGKHVMMAGYAGYGLCGGGIGIYDLETGEELLLTADKELLPGHSTITLKALPNGDLVGGTSVSAPGGGHATATEGELYILDWATKKIVFHTVPVPGDGHIISIQVADDGLVYGLSSGSTFFVFDPGSKQVVHSESFRDYGGVPRHALQLGPDGKLYASCQYKRGWGPGERAPVLRQQLARVELRGPRAQVAAGLTRTVGSHVWSYEVPGLK